MTPKRISFDQESMQVTCLFAERLGQAYARSSEGHTENRCFGELLSHNGGKCLHKSLSLVVYRKLQSTSGVLGSHRRCFLTIRFPPGPHVGKESDQAQSWATCGFSAASSRLPLCSPHFHSPPPLHGQGYALGIKHSRQKTKEL